MSDLQCITLERENSAAILTICNTAKRNAFTKDMRWDLTAKLNELQLDPSVRTIILTGAEGHFCAGADISKLAKSLDPGVFELRENYRDTLFLLRAMADGTKPIIAAVEGSAVGAGFSLALLSDFMIVARNATFGAFFAKIGILPDMGILHTLQRRVGVAQMRKMLMLATPVSGEEGEKIGLVDELTEPGQALAVAKEWAARMEKTAPLVQSAVRIALRNGVNSLDDAIRTELDFQPVMSCSSDAKEGMAAFLEKRTAKFTGR